MFAQVLKEVVDSTEGGVAGLLMGFDGITVDKYVRGGGDVDVQTVGMEYSVILKKIMEAAEMLEIGTANEVAIKAERMTTVIRLLTPEYFVAVTLHPEGNLGKARYLLRTRAQQLAADLG